MEQHHVDTIGQRRKERLVETDRSSATVTQMMALHNCGEQDNTRYVELLGELATVAADQIRSHSSLGSFSHASQSCFE